ncbi:MAG TPA: Hpt domain-containing protein [Geothrix sp.]|nr:Hpt domain-containing protein [Geothrix sp.]
MSDLPILDPSPLQDLLDIGAGMDVVRELIGMLREDVPSRLVLLRTALDAADARTVMMEAHQLKGSLGNLGLARFSNLARLIEEQARAGSLEGVAAWVDQIPGACEESLKALDEAFPAE